jgi:hypothetical protein
MSREDGELRWSEERTGCEVEEQRPAAEVKGKNSVYWVEIAGTDCRS